MSLASGSLIASPTNILTIHDVILDSPVWRANLLHLEDQIEHFEKWIDGFLRALKGYIDVIKKYNTQASTLCKKTFFHDIDDSLIVGNVINKFASTLQSTIAYKMKMASDIEDLLYNPLQKLMRQDIKDYKDCKKQFDKTLDKYETQLYRYNQLSKQREASALREDAFQMYDHRKSYIRSSGEYFMKLISFKSTIENMLIEYFSNALNLHMEELDESTYVYDSVKDKLSGWKQWLLEVIYNYSVSRILHSSLYLLE
ncbi:hypothetical protein BDB01DRAFT_38100 [Pilobolus umbonatus]|nr:hypothetical protein BDB01DRAFT_38100 [Pilobolus umbonatus]